MKIKALQSFGLEDRSFEPGEEATVRADLFGDNLASFVDGGLVEVTDAKPPKARAASPADPVPPDPEIPAAQEPSQTTENAPVAEPVEEPEVATQRDAQG